MRGGESVRIERLLPLFRVGAQPSFGPNAAKDYWISPRECGRILIQIKNKQRKQTKLWH